MATLHRRDLIRLSGSLAIAGGLSACAGEEVAEAMPPVEGELTGPEDALRRLLEGNERFMRGETVSLNEDPKRRAKVAGGQEPFAIIVSCADSRVPPELLFDRGFGDLFVTRTAGQAVDGVVMGSIEYGAHHLHIPLIMVMGHERCGAVKATVDAVEAERAGTTEAAGAEAGESTTEPANSIGTLVELIRPAVEDVIDQGGDTVDKAINANVFRIIEQLETSPTLKELLASAKLRIVGSRYDLDSGRVELIP